MVLESFTLRSQTERMPPVTDHVKRTFTPEDLDCLSGADITYVRISESRLYLSFVFDTCSRRIVGWSMSEVVDLLSQESQLAKILNYSLQWRESPFECQRGDYVP